ncbi:hypothetical protein CYMTET_27789 [Cymbomonas tetramitiformis]|uniref:Uncharacterized protein n=1 Tax=Cymbomonas tetramitiformis TaxID=36881 RepID=A0AAE0KWU6_9CHLO|nr:hypothetical protein CYMTET_27789 [Cymbomonas tetramitiformis]
MGDYQPTAFKGDPSVPHADESNFKAFIGGAWGFVAFSYLSDLMDPRPKYTPDYVLAAAEESHRRKCQKKGVQYKSILQVREEKFPKMEKQRKLWTVERLM